MDHPLLRLLLIGILTGCGGSTTTGEGPQTGASAPSSTSDADATSDDREPPAGEEEERASDADRAPGDGETVAGDGDGEQSTGDGNGEPEPDNGEPLPGDASEPAGDAPVVIGDAPEPAGDGPALPTLASCVRGNRPTGLASEDWRHTSTRLVTLGDPGHSAQDQLVPPGGPLVIAGKFAYGPTSKDLEDEWIQIWIDDCAGSYRLLAEALTDSDGRIRHTIPLAQIPPIGTYHLHLRVKGDDSWTPAVLRVLPVTTKLIVFDIDGTLTTSDEEVVQDVFADLFAPLGSGDYVPTARSSAVAITQARAQQGYPIIYLSGRPYLLTSLTRGWLLQLGFVPGHVHVTDSNSEVLPNIDGVGAFKVNYLNSLTALGYELDAAYGNAATDIYAYGGAGVSKDRTFLVGPHGGEEGTVDLGDNYDAHLPVAQAEAPPAQPFQP